MGTWLSLEKLAEIRRRFKLDAPWGSNAKALADEYGVCVSTIYRVTQNQQSREKAIPVPRIPTAAQRKKQPRRSPPR
jgi:antitoxin component of RelBE/YafQ-DinJ toxin-antitoxin module